MHITYISSFDATDITSYSGTGYFIPEMLKKSGNEISYMGNLSNLNPSWEKVKRKIYHLAGKKYLIERNPRVLRTWGTHVAKNLSRETELVLGYSSQPFARLKTGKPMAFWTDAVFKSMIDYYDVYSNLCKESIRDGNAMEKAAIQNVSLAIYSSEWAAKEAIKHYGASPDKVKVVTYGANIDVHYTLEDIKARARQKSMQPCNFLFMGVEWERKGGDKAVEIVRMLNQEGFKSNLTIIGVDPGEKVKTLEFVTCHGFVSKSTAEGKSLINNIISNSHFLLLPTRADCTPIVFSEFNAHGIPVITTREGGIPSIIKDGINGFMFDKDDDASVYVHKIMELASNKQKYTELSKSAFNEYHQRLNWNHSMKKLQEVFKEAIHD
jgi:glycosyltransferase involved in cell wall biosynthesis